MEGSNNREDSSVPLMQDPTNREKEFERKHTIRGQCLDEWKKDFCLLVFIILMTLVGITVIIIGTWALVQSIMFFTITTQANIIMMIIAVMTIIMGVLLIIAVIGFLLFLQYQRASIRSRRYFCLLLTVLPGLLFLIVSIVYIVTYFTSAIIDKQAVTSAKMSLFTISDSQEASDAWDAAQKTLKCCGAMNYTDYEEVFNNFSVPVSCCNTTNPLANETTCPDIVMNINQTTDLIYTEGCVSQILSIFEYVSIVDGVGTIFASSTLLSFALTFLYQWCRGWFKMVKKSAPPRHINADGYNSITDSHQENAENETL